MEEGLQRQKEKLHKTLMGIYSYNILCNPIYCDKFQYIPPSVPDRNNYIVDADDDDRNNYIQSDMTLLILYLGYQSKKKARNFNFDKKSIL